MASDQLAKRNFSELRTMLEKARPALQAVATKHMTPDRIAKIVLATVSRNHSLAECDPLSILRCVITSTQLGLDCSGLMGDAYMVPFKNNYTGRKEAQFIIGYRGLVGLARRTGELEQVEARTVHAGDVFDYEFGLHPKFVHRPAPDVPREKETCTHAYAIWRLRGGAVHVDVMTKAEIDRIQRMSKAGNSGPWVDHWIEMAKKTVIRRSAKLVPMTIEMADAFEAENRSELGLSPALALTGATEYDVIDEAEDERLLGEQDPEEKAESRKIAKTRPNAKKAEPDVGSEEWAEAMAHAQDLLRGLDEAKRAEILRAAGIAKIAADTPIATLREIIAAAEKEIG